MALIAVITAVNASNSELAQIRRVVRTHHHHRWLSERQNHGHFADSQTKAPRSLRLNPLVREQPRYLLCTCGKARLTVLPRSHTVSVGVTIRLRDVKRACFPRPKAGWQSGTTSSGRSRRLYFLPTYPYSTHGGAGPISGGPRGRQGSVQNPGCGDHNQHGKGVKGVKSRIKTAS